MDKNVLWYLEKKVERTIDALKKNNMEGYFVKDEAALKEKLNELLKGGSTVSVGGSMTLFEAGVIDYLRNGNYNFLDRYDEDLTPADLKKLYRDTFYADTYICSTNALTESGELYNVDGNGNRVAAMLFGPDQVIVIAGANKIVRDLEEAEVRMKRLAAPVNAKRLNKNTPCAKVGYCTDCHTDERICSDYVVLKRQKTKGRIKVIIVGKELGY